MNDFERTGGENLVEKLNINELETSPSGNLTRFAEFDTRFIPIQEKEKFEDHMEHYPDGESELYIRIDPERIKQIDPNVQFKHAKILFDKKGTPQIFLFGREVEDAATNAVKDQLTELDNREGLNNQLMKIAENIQRGYADGKYITIGYYDLNFLKLINDTQNRTAGDKCLVAMAKHLKDVLRLNDEIARVGGDEFVTVTISDIDIRKGLERRLKNSGKGISYCSGLFGIKIGDLLEEVDFPQETEHMSRTDLAFKKLKEIEQEADNLLLIAKKESNRNMTENEKPTVIVTNSINAFQ